MARRLRLDEPIQVEDKPGKPCPVPVKVQGRPVGVVIDGYRICPNWWEGHKPRNYWLIEVEDKTLEIYQTKDGWFFGGYRE